LPEDEMNEATPSNDADDGRTLPSQQPGDEILHRNQAFLACFRVDSVPPGVIPL